ncbi:MAG: CDP-alcohol phosphatidyltransferase family protein [Ferruginibacter sp.]
MEETRRPLKTRNVAIIQWFARKLCQTGISPNQISVLSSVFAMGASGCFLLLLSTQNFWFSILAAIFIQCRLLCNLFDGLVAVEGKKGTPSGPLFNEIPDRIADSFILIAVGYAITSVAWGATMGWFSALMAMATAYVRVLATAEGAPTKFTGPMAKPHRMAILTFACLGVPIEQYLYGTLDQGLIIVLCIIGFGSVITMMRRTWDAYYYLERK